ncbi:MAG: hypothetical protein R3B89_00955 [Polyangiaceae bacterium]
MSAPFVWGLSLAASRCLPYRVLTSSYTTLRRFEITNLVEEAAVAVMLALRTVRWIW